MQELLSVFKTVSLGLSGMVTLSYILLLSTSLAIPDSAPYRVTQWLFGIAGGFSAVVFAAAVTMLLYTTWRKVEIDTILRPLPDEKQTRFLTQIQPKKKFAVLEVSPKETTGVMWGGKANQNSHIAPIIFSAREQFADAQIPFPEAYKDEELARHFFETRSGENR